MLPADQVGGQRGLPGVAQPHERGHAAAGQVGRSLAQVTEQQGERDAMALAGVRQPFQVGPGDLISTCDDHRRGLRSGGDGVQG